MGRWVLGVDIGNSNVKFGLHDGAHWVRFWPVATVRDKMPDEYAVLLRSFLAEVEVAPADVGRAILSSVVPQLTDGFRHMLHQQTGREPLVLRVDLKLGIEVATESPRSVGSDLIANAVAGYALYGSACLVVNLGTATTLVAVSDGGKLHGVSIAAGRRVTENALVGGAAQLAHVPLDPPPDVLGRTTLHAMQSGLVLGHVAMIEGLIARIQKAHGKHRVVATGGLAGRLAAQTDIFDQVDPYLTLEGLRLIGEQNPPPPHEHGHRQRNGEGDPSASKTRSAP